MSDFKLTPSNHFPQADASTDAASRQADAGSSVNFRVMMRRGGRDDKSKAVQVQQYCLAVIATVPAILNFVDFRRA